MRKKSEFNTIVIYKKLFNYYAQQLNKQNNN